MIFQEITAYNDIATVLNVEEEVDQPFLSLKHNRR